MRDGKIFFQGNDKIIQISILAVSMALLVGGACGRGRLYLRPGKSAEARGGCGMDSLENADTEKTGKLSVEVADRTGVDDRPENQKLLKLGQRNRNDAEVSDGENRKEDVTLLFAGDLF